MARIVSVHSFRGGTGKSNMTANLATTWPLQGLRVGIVDTDIQSPGIHVIFGLDESQINRALNDYLWGQCAIEDTAYNIPLPQVAAARRQHLPDPVEHQGGRDRPHPARGLRRRPAQRRLPGPDRPG